MKRSILISLYLIGLLSFTQAQNLVPNPGFEAGMGSWIAWGSEPAVSTVNVDAVNPHSGLFSCLITCHGSPAANTLIGNNIALQEGHHYLLEYWVRSDSVNQYMLPIIKFQHDTNLVFESYLLPTGIEPGWTKMSNRFIVPDSSNNLLFGMILLGPGKIWLDDFSLVELTDSTVDQFNVELGNTSGSFNELFSTNNGPGNPANPNNHIMKFQEMGLDYVRTHDYSIAFDYHAIFPDTSRNPLDPTAYQFQTTDSCVADIIDASGYVYYRLGESYDISHTYNAPPLNPDKFAQVSLQIIKHYNAGWNNGFYYNIDHFEIWNEPDIADFWNGSVQQYIRLYELTATRIKQYDPSLKVGGPAVSNVFNNSFILPFLDSVVAKGLPLDFLSYHLYYYPNPWYYKVTNDYARARLDERGLTATELYNTEWNPFMFSFVHFNDWGMDDALNAATTVSAMRYLQETPIDKLFRYATENYWFGLVDWNDQYRYSGLAYRAMHELMNYQQPLVTSGGDSLGTTIMASASQFGDLVHILVASNSSSAAGYDLHINNIAPGEAYHFLLYRIDEQNRYYMVGNGTLSVLGSILYSDARAPFVEHIVLQRIVGMEDQIGTEGLFARPNPFHDKLQISYYLDEPTEIILRLLDVQGREIYRSDQGRQDAGLHDIELQVSENENLSVSGIFFLQLILNGNAQKLLKVVRG